MLYKNDQLLSILETLDIGNSVAEQDALLSESRVETSAFTDLLHDKVDLIPGTKGSGKSALFRIFSDFLPNFLLQRKKVVVAHGIQKHGDSVFHAFKDQFEQLSEDDFVEFWCIYLVSLAHEQFIKGARYKEYLSAARDEIEIFRQECERSNIPEIKASKTLKQILEWSLCVLKGLRPKLTYTLPNEGGEFALDFSGNPDPVKLAEKSRKNKNNECDVFSVPTHITDIKESLEEVLKKCGLCIWLMVDRLDELFPRRSPLENRALRGLLRVTRVFTSDCIRVKVFLRDDMLKDIVSDGDGFTALTHVTSRQADTLRWSEDQVLDLIVKRVFSKPRICSFYGVDIKKCDSYPEYRSEAFYKVFPLTVHNGSRQSSTLRWIYTHVADGNGVVAPRDVINLLEKAKQKQQDFFSANISGESSCLFEPSAIRYGLTELSSRKRDTYLMAEFPHLWPHIKKFIGGKTSLSDEAVAKILGNDWRSIVEDLVSIGVISGRKNSKTTTFSFPYLYRAGLDLSQGTEE